MTGLTFHAEFPYVREDCLMRVEASGFEHAFARCSDWDYVWEHPLVRVWISIDGSESFIGSIAPSEFAGFLTLPTRRSNWLLDNPASLGDYELVLQQEQGVGKPYVIELSAAGRNSLRIVFSEEEGAKWADTVVDLFQRMKRYLGAEKW